MWSDFLIMGIWWDVLKVFLVDDGWDYRIDEDGLFWCVMSFIEGVEIFDMIWDMEYVEEMGCVVGLFYIFIYDLFVEFLEDMLLGFYVIFGYFRCYDVL